MTEGKHFKRLVRRRMSKTGESYTAARAQLRVQLSRQAPEVGRRWPDRLRNGWYPWGTDPAGHALRYAQATMAAAGTDHVDGVALLRGLQREPCSLAGRILAAFGVSEDTLLSIVAGGSAVAGAAPGGHQRADWMILDAARAAADGAGRAHIATDDLLLGAFPVLPGRAATALAASGCTRAAVTAEARRLRAMKLEEVALAFPAAKELARTLRSQNRPDESVAPDVREALVRACGVAQRTGGPVSPRHLAAALMVSPGGTEAATAAARFELPPADVASPAASPLGDGFRRVVWAALNAAERARKPEATMEDLIKGLRATGTRPRTAPKGENSP